MVKLYEGGANTRKAIKPPKPPLPPVTPAAKGGSRGPVKPYKPRKPTSYVPEAASPTTPTANIAPAPSLTYAQELDAIRARNASWFRANYVSPNNPPAPFSYIPPVASPSTPTVNIGTLSPIGPLRGATAGAGGNLLEPKPGSWEDRMRQQQQAWLDWISGHEKMLPRAPGQLDYTPPGDTTGGGGGFGTGFPYRRFGRGGYGGGYSARNWITNLMNSVFWRIPGA